MTVAADGRKRMAWHLVLKTSHNMMEINLEYLPD